MGMAEDRDLSPTHRAASLETCPACGRPFVVPVALLDLVDEGLYLLALQCKNCDCLFTGEVEDAALEALEHANDAAVAEIESALDIVSVARFIDELGSFTRALEAGGVLPEDF
jgi:transcription elongation factor Elf1